jgi:rod shape-determining protein MreC
MRLLWWTPAVLALSLLSILLSESRTLDPFQNITLTVSAPIQTGIGDLAEPTSSFLEGLFNRGDIVRENERLRAELERLQAELAGSEEARRRIHDLEQALDIRESRPEDEILLADVIAQDPSGVKRALAINRGSADGLDEGMVVLSKSGSLVGTVSQVFDDFAWLRLVSDPNSAVNVAVLPASDKEEEVRGVAAGDLRSSLSLDLLPADAAIKEGDFVTTSGLGGNYPPALLVGSVQSVEEQPQALTKRARIEPAAELSSLETVLIITNFLPARLAGQ